MAGDKTRTMRHLGGRGERGESVRLAGEEEEGGDGGSGRFHDAVLCWVVGFDWSWEWRWDDSLSRRLLLYGLVGTMKNG